MFSCKSCLGLCLLLGSSIASGADFMLGGGVEADSADGWSLSGAGGLALPGDNWLSAGIARSSAELGNGRSIDNLYLDAELDHYMDPAGFTLGATYWGDSDVLESRDWRASAYWRGDRARISAEFENRSFDLTIPATELRPARMRSFDANGFGASFRVDLGKSADLRLAGMAYDYSVPFRPVQDQDIIDLISVSRLSVINSLVDHRASITLGIEQGEKRWELQAATSEGEIARVRRNSYSLRYLLPMSGSSDIEVGLGFDESEIFSNVTYASVHVYFYALD